MSKIGLIQTRGIGDSIISLPIAQHFIDQGHEVVYPIDERWIPMFKAAAPQVDWRPVFNPIPEQEPKGTLDYFLKDPIRIVQESGCTTMHVQYNHLNGIQLPFEALARHMKFDEFKYAVCNVPFIKKWDLARCITRSPEREQALFDKLYPGKPYIIAHMRGSNVQVPMGALDKVRADYELVVVDPKLTDSVFDWIMLFERAERIFCICSVFANIVDQLRMEQKKYLVLRDTLPGTSIYGMGWHYIWAEPGVAPTLQKVE